MRLTRYNSRGDKLCSQRTCSTLINRRFLMCVTHWNAVPKELRLRIWAALRAFENAPSDGAKLHTLQQLQAEAIALVS